MGFSESMNPLPTRNSKPSAFAPSVELRLATKIGWSPSRVDWIWNPQCDLADDQESGHNHTKRFDPFDYPEIPPLSRLPPGRRPGGSGVGGGADRWYPLSHASIGASPKVSHRSPLASSQRRSNWKATHSLKLSLLLRLLGDDIHILRSNPSFTQVGCTF